MYSSAYTDSLKLSSSFSKCPQTYDQRLRNQRACLSAMYTADSIIVATPASVSVGDYIQLNDDGIPAALLKVGEAGAVTLVNSPIYKSPPTNPVTSKNLNDTAGPTFTVTVKKIGCNC